MTSAMAGEALVSSGGTGGWTTFAAGICSGTALVLSTAIRLDASLAATAFTVGAGVNRGTSACALSSSHPTHHTRLLTAKANADTRNNRVFINISDYFFGTGGRLSAFVE